MEARVLNSAERLIVRILQEVYERVGQPIFRTHLVKLVYLADYNYARYTGKTISGLTYVYDNFGPNAANNEIIKTADALKAQGIINMGRSATGSGSPSYLYRVGTSHTPVHLDDELAERIADDVVRVYGGMNWSKVVDASKATEPFRSGAMRGDVLRLTKDRELENIESVIAEKQRSGRYENQGRGLTARELRVRYGLG